MKDKIESIRKEVYNLFRGPEAMETHPYVCRDWIFPHHFDIAIDLAKEMCDKYEGDKDICELALLLHDTGLVFKRTESSPEGHEERSLELARKPLKQNDISEDTINEIIARIEVTDPKHEPTTINQK